MVKRIINFLGREINGLHEAAYLLGIFAVLSQVLALVRDRLLAHSFGAGATLDLYYAAFRIPDFIFAVVASLFSASIVIPFLSEKVKTSKETGREFFSAMFSVFLVVMIIVCGLAFFAIPSIVSYLFPGFSAEPLKGHIVLLTRILLLSPIFLGLSNLFASVTQLYNRFFIYAISPLLYNIGIICGVVFLAPKFGPAGLAWGVATGAILHFMVQVPFVMTTGLFPRLLISFKKYRIALNALTVALPRTLALSAQEVSEFFLISLASLMSIGSISVFSLSFNLQSVPLSIIGVSYSLAAFPTLSALFAAGERGRFIELLQTTARHIIFCSMPLVALFVVLRAHIVRVVLGSGAFTWESTRLTAAALALFVVSLAAQGLILLFTRARYASGNTRIPFYINIFSVIITIASASFLSRLVLVWPAFRFFIESLFRVDDVAGTSVLMLPLAFSLGGIITVIVHAYTFERDYPHTIKPIFQTLLQATSVSVIVGFVAYVALQFVDNFLTLDTFVGVLAQGLIAGIFATICGIILFAILGSRELKEVSHVFINKLWKTPVIGPDPDTL